MIVFGRMVVGVSTSLMKSISKFLSFTNISQFSRFQSFTSSQDSMPTYIIPWRSMFNILIVGALVFAFHGIDRARYVKHSSFPSFRSEIQSIEHVMQLMAFGFVQMFLPNPLQQSMVRRQQLQTSPLAVLLVLLLLILSHLSAFVAIVPHFAMFWLLFSSSRSSTVTLFSSSFLSSSYAASSPAVSVSRYVIHPHVFLAFLVFKIGFKLQPTLQRPTDLSWTSCFGNLRPHHRRGHPVHESRRSDQPPFHYMVFNSDSTMHASKSIFIALTCTKILNRIFRCSVCRRVPNDGASLARLICSGI